MTVALLNGVVRRYAWGSSTAIQHLLGLSPDGRPMAELWFGAHPDDPSPAPSHSGSLDELIARDPVAALGERVAADFGGRLPYLLKILAADKALSIQVHPTLRQAQAGFARENLAGLPPDADARSYRDANHKPELICALTPFEALCGFRSPMETAAIVDELGVAELGFLVDALRGPDPLRRAFTALLEHSEPTELAHAVGARAKAANSARGPLHAAALAADDFPDDIGVVLSLLLNYVTLGPGEAMFLAAGNVHAYLRGTGIEIMANSDNVLRCGLTTKHIDVPELLAVTDFSSLADPRVASVGGAYETRVRDFRLSVLDLDPGESTGLDDPGPSIALCADGQVTVGDVELSPGRAAFVFAGTPTVLRGSGKVFVASVGHSSGTDVE